MDPRTIETRLARFSLAILVIYFPAETWVSLPHGPWNPFYLVDLIAMLLLLWGGLHSLRARPRAAPGLLAAAWGWASANGWRGTSWRVLDWIEGGGRVERGVTEVWAVGIATLLALGCFALSLMLVVRVARTGR